MTGPKPKVFALPVSSWVLPPPIGRAAAELAYGEPIASGAWGAILSAFRRYGFDRDALAAAPRVNANRKDPRSYPVVRARACNKFGEALEFVREFQTDPVSRAIGIAALGRTGAARVGGDLKRHLLAAELELMKALAIVNAAPPEPPVTCMTEADLRQRLAREIVRALADSGHDRSLSGWSLAGVARPSDSDLAPVERLLCALQVPPGFSRPSGSDQPDTVARWIREALRE
jgi:hypothetical protein